MSAVKELVLLAIHDGVATITLNRPQVLNALNTQVFDELENLFTDDFVQSTFPSSLNVPPRTKQEDLEFLRGLSEQLGGRHLQVQYSTTACSSLPSRPLRALSDATMD